MSFSTNFSHPGNHLVMQSHSTNYHGPPPTQYDTIVPANGLKQPIETFRLDIPVPHRPVNSDADPQMTISDSISSLYIPTYQILRALALSDRSMTIWSTDRMKSFQSNMVNFPPLDSMRPYFSTDTSDISPNGTGKISHFFLVSTPTTAGIEQMISSLRNHGSDTYQQLKQEKATIRQHNFESYSIKPIGHLLFRSPMSTNLKTSALAIRNEIASHPSFQQNPVPYFELDTRSCTQIPGSTQSETVQLFCDQQNAPQLLSTLDNMPLDPNTGTFVPLAAETTHPTEFARCFQSHSDFLDSLAMFKITGLHPEVLNHPVESGNPKKTILTMFRAPYLDRDAISLFDEIHEPEIPGSWLCAAPDRSRHKAIAHTASTIQNYCVYSHPFLHHKQHTPGYEKGIIYSRSSKNPGTIRGIITENIQIPASEQPNQTPIWARGHSDTAQTNKPTEPTPTDPAKATTTPGTTTLPTQGWGHVTTSTVPIWPEPSPGPTTAAPQNPNQSILRNPAIATTTAHPTPTAESAADDRSVTFSPKKTESGKNRDTSSHHQAVNNQTHPTRAASVDLDRNADDHKKSTTKNQRSPVPHNKPFPHRGPHQSHNYGPHQNHNQGNQRYPPQPRGPPRRTHSNQPPPDKRRHSSDNSYRNQNPNTHETHPQPANLFPTNPQQLGAAPTTTAPTANIHVPNQVPFDGSGSSTATSLTTEITALKLSNTEKDKRILAHESTIAELESRLSGAYNKTDISNHPDFIKLQESTKTLATLSESQSEQIASLEKQLATLKTEHSAAKAHLDTLHDSYDATLDTLKAEIAIREKADDKCNELIKANKDLTEQLQKAHRANTEATKTKAPTKRRKTNNAPAVPYVSKIPMAPPLVVATPTALTGQNTNTAVPSDPAPTARTSQTPRDGNTTMPPPPQAPHPYNHPDP